MSKAGFMLSFKVTNLQLDLDDIFYGVLEAHKNNDEKKVGELIKEYERTRRMLSMGIEMIEECLEDWDWKWMADGGHLSDWDWNEFGDALAKNGVNREEFDKKWKQ